MNICCFQKILWKLNMSLQHSNLWAILKCLDECFMGYIFSTASLLSSLSVRLNTFPIGINSGEREVILNISSLTSSMAFLPFLNIAVDIHPSRTAFQLSHCLRQMFLGNHCEQYWQIFPH